MGRTSTTKNDTDEPREVRVDVVEEEDGLQSQGPERKEN